MDQLTVVQIVAGNGWLYALTDKGRIFRKPQYEPVMKLSDMAMAPDDWSEVKSIEVKL